VGLIVAKGKFTPYSERLGIQEYVLAAADRDYFKGSKSIHQDRHYLLNSVGTGSKATLYVGDSHMFQYAPRVINLVESHKAQDRQAIFLVDGGQIPLPDVIDSRQKDRSAFNKKLDELFRDPSIDRVVISANWSYYFNEGGNTYFINGYPLLSPLGASKALQGLQQMILLARDRGKKVLVVLNIPTSSSLDPRAMIQRSLFGGVVIRTQKLFLTDITMNKGLMNINRGELMEKIKSSSLKAGAEVVDPMPYLVRDGICISVQENKPIYCDAYHLRREYVRDSVTYLDRTMLQW
jgi:hypothetical protein